MAGSTPGKPTIRTGVIEELHAGHRCVVRIDADTTVVAQLAKNFNRPLHRARVGETVRVARTGSRGFVVLH